MNENPTTCIIALSFGDADDGRHGKSNWALAQAVSELEGKYYLPVIAQWEIAQDLYSLDLPAKPISIRIPDGETYIDTYDVLLKAKEIMVEKEYKYAVFMTHPAHYSRVKKTAEKLGIKESGIEAGSYRATVPYDPNSTQPWTRNAVIFSLYDFFATALYWYKGYI